MARDYIEKRNGGLYVEGTRVSLDSIVQAFNEGLSAESIRDEFDSLQLTQVYGAITYYLENQSAVDEYRGQQEQRFAEMRKAVPLLPADLIERLQAARESLSQAKQ